MQEKKAVVFQHGKHTQDDNDAAGQIPSGSSGVHGAVLMDFYAAEVCDEDADDRI